MIDQAKFTSVYGKKLQYSSRIWNTRSRVSFFTTPRQHLSVNRKNTTGIKSRILGRWAGLGEHRFTNYLCIYFQACFQSAVGSSVPSGGALGSRKSGCWSSFRYLGGVRMWVEPTRDKRLKGQQGLNSGWRPVYYLGCTLGWRWQSNPLVSD